MKVGGDRRVGADARYRRLHAHIERVRVLVYRVLVYKDEVPNDGPNEVPNEVIATRPPGAHAYRRRQTSRTGTLAAAGGMT